MTADAPPRIRPGLVWAICLMQLFGFVTFATLQALRAMPWLPVNVALEGLFGRLTPFDWGAQWSVAALGVTAATLLFFLKRAALWASIAWTITGSANTMRLLVVRGWAESLIGTGSFGLFVLVVLVLSLLISVAILAYVVSLHRRGVLA